MQDFISRLDHTLDWRWLPDMVQYVIEQATTIQQIPAPTFDEKARADYLATVFKAANLLDIEIDQMFNVYGRLPGQHPDRPALMVAAHTDTVFPAGTDLTLRRENGLIYGPGLGDNSFGVAGMLGLLETMRTQRITPDCDFWFVATTGEEGLGNLGGMKAAYAHLQPLLQGVINLEGLAFGHIYHAGIAVRRLHITASAAGGHSWLHFGRPSAIHAIIQLGSHILAANPPQTPRTTYNIGMIEGGQGINVIATSAGMWLDLRSEDRDALGDIEQQVRGYADSLGSPDLSFEIEVVGDRPAGRIAPEHPLVQMALAVLHQIGVEGVLETGSTDGNIPLADGCPAVTIGITRGGNAHRLDEYVEVEPVAAGLRQLILLALAASAEKP